MPIKTLIAGGAGYLGLMLVKTLLNSGRTVTVLDSLLHRQEPALDEGPSLAFVKGDIRDISLVRWYMKDHDEAVLLASLVGEAACSRDPGQTLEVNCLAPLNFAETAARTQVKRLIFASTDSCYGQRENERLTEASPLAPLSLYARYKAEVEDALRRDFRRSPLAVTILRLATLYGLSPRMRFDLALNLLTREAAINKKIQIFSGEQWRPFIHTSDAARAFQLALDAPPELTAGEIFNAGSNEQNIQFRDLGRLLAQLIPGTKVETVPQNPDLRDYYVSFDKIHKVLGFEPQFTPAMGISEIQRALESGLFPDPYAPSLVN